MKKIFILAAVVVVGCFLMPNKNTSAAEITSFEDLEIKNSLKFSYSDIENEGFDVTNEYIRFRLDIPADLYDESFEYGLEYVAGDKSGVEVLIPLLEDGVYKTAGLFPLTDELLRQDITVKMYQDVNGVKSYTKEKTNSFYDVCKIYVEQYSDDEVVAKHLAVLKNLDNQEFRINAKDALGSGDYAPGSTVTLEYNGSHGNDKGIESIKFMGWKDSDTGDVLTTDTTYEIESLDKDLNIEPIYQFQDSNEYFYVDNQNQQHIIAVDRFTGGQGYSIFNELGNAYYEDVKGIKIYVYDDANQTNEVASFMLIRENNMYKLVYNDNICNGAPFWKGYESLENANGNVLGNGYFYTAPDGGDYSSEDNNVIIFLMNVINDFALDHNYYFATQVIAKEVSSINSSDILFDSAKPFNPTVALNFKKASVVQVINGSGSAVYKNNTNATVTATVEDGKTFIGWYDEENNLVSTNQEYTFNVLKNEKLIAKTVEAVESNISIDTLENGIITVKGSLSKAFTGTVITLIVTPNAGYYIEPNCVMVNGEAIGSVDGVYSFVMPSEDVLITAEFTLLPTEGVNIKVTGGLLENGLNEGLFNEQEQVTITYTEFADTDENSVLKEFVGWYEGDTLLSTEKVYTFKVINEMNIFAKYKFISSTANAFVSVLSNKEYLNIDRLGHKDNNDAANRDDQWGVLGKNNTAANYKGYSILDNEDVDCMKIYFYIATADGHEEDACVVATYMLNEQGKPVLVYEKEDGNLIIVESTSAWDCNQKGCAGFNINEDWGKGSASDLERMSVWFKAILGDNYNADSRYYVGSQIISSNESTLDGDVVVDSKSFACVDIYNKKI